jgi:hypothetical protein
MAIVCCLLHSPVSSVDVEVMRPKLSRLSCSQYRLLEQYSNIDLFVWVSGVSCPEDCGAPTQTLVWSAWLDRDDPSGTGDWETRADFTLSQVGCSSPSQIDAKTLTGVAWQNTGEVLTVSPIVGLICRNADQSDGACQDYEVRFGCLVQF